MKLKTIAAIIAAAMLPVFAQAAEHGAAASAPSGHNTTIAATTPTAMPTPEQSFALLDMDKNTMLTKEEFSKHFAVGTMPADIDAAFIKADMSPVDGMISLTELTTFLLPPTATTTPTSPMPHTMEPAAK